MNKYEIVRRIERFAPVDTAEPWDCIGFMAETGKTEVSKIMISLTPADDVIRQAIERHCDMIVAHHPMFYVDFKSGLINENYSPKIDIYSAHTNADKAYGGTTDTIIKVLELNKYQKQIPHEFLRCVILPKAVNVIDFAQTLKKISPNLRYVNNKHVEKISKIMFCAGSGAEFIEDAARFGADCLVTGDLKFHTALDSSIVLYDIGHFESEVLIREVFKSIIGNGVQVVFADEKSPFNYV